MKHPRHDLTWRGIRRRWMMRKEEANNINGSVGKHHYKYLSTPLLDDVLELLPNNNTINVDSQLSDSLNDRNKQHPHSVRGCSVSPTSRIPQSHNQRDLSKALNTYQTEMIRSELRIITSHLAILSHRVRREEKYNKESEDWKFVAMVIDRLCLILFTISMIVFTGSTLFSVPNFFKLE